MALLYSYMTIEIGLLFDQYTLSRKKTCQLICCSVSVKYKAISIKLVVQEGTRKQNCAKSAHFS